MAAAELHLAPATIEAIRALIRDLANTGGESEDLAEEFLSVLQTRYGQVPYALALNVLVAGAANPQGGSVAWLAFHALKLLLRRIAVHFEDIADALGLSKTEAPLVELANRARQGDRAAVDVLAFLTMYTMAPGSG